MTGLGKFLVWCPDRGQGEEEATELAAEDVEAAAELYAERYAGFSGDPFSYITLHIASQQTDRLFEVTVQVEATPHFYSNTPRELHDDGEAA